MEKIGNYLNILHYCFYKTHYKMHLFANTINPFRLLTKIPIIKKRLEKKGIKDFQTHINKTFSDKHFGLSVTAAGGMLWGFMGIFFFSLLIIFNIVISSTFVVICLFVPALVCYLFVFKNDRYIGFFDKYENWSKAEKRKSAFLTFASVIIVFIIFYIGLKT